MKKTERIMLVSCAVLLVLFLSMLLVSGSISGRSNRVYRISVVYGYGELSKNMRRGMDSAALDMQVDLRTVPMAEGAAAAEFALAVEQELKGSAETVIVMGGGSSFYAWLEGYGGASDVVVLGDSSERAGGYVAANDRELGVMLAGEILKLYSDVDIFCSENPDRAESERFAGLEETLAASGAASRRATASSEAEISFVGATRSAAAVALCGDVLERLYTGKYGYSGFYGFGAAAGETLYALESGRVNALAVFSEYDLGYIGVKTAVGQISSVRKDAIALASYVVTGKNMFEAPFEQVLFPIG